MTHLATSVLFGAVALLLVSRDHPVTRLEAGVVLLWSALFASLPDAELAFGMHRDLFTNVWVLIVVPPLVAARLMARPMASGVTVRALLLSAPASLASHLWLDTFGFSNRFAALFWPLDKTVYIGQEVRLRGFDEGSVYLLAVLWLVLTMVVHERMAKGMSGDARQAYGLGLMLVASELGPFLLLLTVGGFGTI
ncbi:MAG: hypothetical protein KY455_06555 [Euryarchaeota archaeon]|nr:hypothetical protein [Euryarchaeota archaeon]